MSITCRCPICGNKNGGGNKSRRAYARVNMARDENNRIYDADSKVEERRLRRTREKRQWQRRATEWT